VTAYQPRLFSGVDYDALDSDSWTTPAWALDLVREFFGGVIDLDPCSNPASTVGATTEYTVADDGLTHPWAGRVWVNPPYSSPAEWMRRCLAAYREGHEVLAMPKGDWSVSWWRDYVLPAPARCQLHERVAFGAGGKKAPFPSAVICYSDRVDEFRRLFEPHGEVVP
jgi:hypothetical protein